LKATNRRLEMKLIVKEDTQVWINGVEYQIQAGLRDVDDNVAFILLEAKKAEKVEEEDKKKK
jgi:hypothetical protein